MRKWTCQSERTLYALIACVVLGMAYFFTLDLLGQKKSAIRSNNMNLKKHIYKSSPQIILLQQGSVLPPPATGF